MSINILYNKVSTLVQRDDFKKFVKTSWSLSWPMTIVVFFLFLMNITGVYISGAFGKEIQAAYGFVLQVYFITMVVAHALNVGTVSVISRLYSSKKHEECERSIFSTITFAFMCGIGFGVIGFIIIPIVIRFLSLPEAVKPLATPLFRIYILGLMFHYPFLISNGVLRATGRIKKSLVSSTTALLTIVILALSLSFKTKLGYLGIGIAHLIGISVGCLMNMYFLRDHLLPFKKFIFQNIKKEVSIGWPSGLTQISWQLANMVIYLIIGSMPMYGVETMAAFTAGLRFESLVFMPAFAFSLANAVVVGNLLGEDKQNDAFIGGLVTAGMGMFVVIIMSVLVVLNVHWVMPLFTHNEIVLKEAVNYVYIAMIAEPFLAWGMILTGALNGAGDTKNVLKMVAGSLWLVRVPIAYILAVKFSLGPTSLWWAMNVSLFVMAIVLTKRYFGKKWLYSLKV